MKIIFLLLTTIYITSCNNRQDYSRYNENKDDVYMINNNLDNNTYTNNNYKFTEGFIKTVDEVNLYYRMFTKKDNKGLIILSHKENSSLEEWDILMDFLLDLNYDVIAYDLRGYGKSKSTQVDSQKRLNDLELIFNFVKNNKNSDYEKIVFIGNGLGANISLYSSYKYCNINSSFIILSPKLKSDDMPILDFNEYCSDSNYLFLYSKNDFNNIDDYDLYIYNYNNLKTIVDQISNYRGIDLLLNNSLFVKEIKNTIISK